MTFSKLGRVIAALLTCGAVSLAGPSGEAARAQTRPIRIIVPVPPGGGMDFLARLLAEQIGRTHGRSFVVESRPGAGGMVAADAVSRMAPDGSALLITYPSFVIDPHLRKLNYDPLTSFEPICSLVDSPDVLVVNGTSPFRTFGDLMDAARAKPGAFTVASIGPASNLHLAIEALKRASGVDLTYVPFTGSAPAVTAVMGEHVTGVLSALPNVSQQLKAGTLRPLVSTTHTRIEALPQVPTAGEAGYPDFEVDNWFGLVAPAKTPAETVSELIGWFQAALRDPDVKSKLVEQGLYPAGVCGADFAALLRRQYTEYGELIRVTRIRSE